MNLRAFVSRSAHMLKDHSPVIFSAAAVGGVVSTAYLSGQFAIKANDKIRFEEGMLGKEVYQNDQEKLKARARLVWKDAIPPITVGAGTIFCIVAANRIGHRRAAAAQSALLVAERAYEEYRSAVVEEIGPHKDEKIRAKVAENQVKENPPPVMVVGKGTVLCCEMFTGRYFKSDKESLRKAENTLNAYLINHDRASFNDFYDLIGLDTTDTSDEIGWWSDKLMELEFTAILTPDGEPCLAFTYNYWRALYDKW